MKYKKIPVILSLFLASNIFPINAENSEQQEVVEAREQGSELASPIIWRGEVNTNLPGTEVIITGKDGLNLTTERTNGRLSLFSDGRFSTERAIELESHYYQPATIDKEQEILDINEQAMWGITGLQYTINGNPVSDAKVIVKDGHSGQIMAMQLGKKFIPMNQIISGRLIVEVENTEKVKQATAHDIANIIISITSGLNTVG